MAIEVLCIEDCPSSDAAVANVRTALVRTALDVPVSVRVIRAAEDAAALAFAGSPTILMDGEDLFPSEGRTGQLACRVYATPSGLRGLPEVDQIIGALADRR